jgi:hypothetical protein
MVRSFSDKGNKHAEILVNPTVIKKKKLGEIDNVGCVPGAWG